MMEYGIHAFTIEDAALLVARMDSNRSGKVNFKEFKNSFLPVLNDLP